MADYRTLYYKQYTKHTFSQNQSPSQFSFDDWGGATRWYIRNWLPQNKDVRIVDLGCGTGTFLKVLEKLGYKNIDGVDISEAQLEIAKSECEISKLHFQSVFEFFKSSDKKFDLITGFDFIEHLNKNEILELFETFKSNLNFGGRVILQTPNPDSPFGMAYRYGDFTHELALSPLSLKSLVNIFDFSEFEVRECGPYPHGFKSLFRFVLWKFIKVIIDIINLIEVGNCGERVYTRVYLATFIKK
jgi:2-polyprenyl-3-methyl-5-hydroxy-6-metoxy-1,4-benzoquinol methylase